MHDVSVMTVRYALFDLGRVVLDWEPSRLYSKIFDTIEERDWFLANVCTMDWHCRHDAGETFADTRPELIAKFPNYEAQIRAWGDRWDEMFDGYIDGTPDILDRLEARNVPLYALTNMSSETYPRHRENFPKLKIFIDTVVSGDEGLLKPDPAIYELALKRMGSPEPQSVIFIDDSAKNIDAARALGLETHLFDGAAGLEKKLTEVGLL